MINHPKRTEKAGKKKLIIAESMAQHNHDHDYSGLLACVKGGFDRAIANGDPLFMTDAGGDRLWEFYLNSLPAERQVHNCRCCQRFIQTYGGLVTINARGEVSSAMWGTWDAPEFYKSTFELLDRAVKLTKVTGVFISDDVMWGQPITGKWSHLAVQPPAHYINGSKVQTASQWMAQKKEDFRTVAGFLADVKVKTLETAKVLLEAGQIDRSEKFLAPVRWLLDLKTCSRGKGYMLWRAIALAPEGFCHPRASVIGSLLEDIEAGYSIPQVTQRFNAKLHPLAYQRPQVAPAQATIEQAEKLVAKFGIERSLQRRFARVDEMVMIWQPKKEAHRVESKGVFGSIAARGNQTTNPMELKSETMSWAKFRRIVLEKAESIELYVPARGNFEARLTAQHPDAPCIMKWGHHVSSYFYNNGSYAADWGLVPGLYHKVIGISPKPSMWAEGYEYLGQGMLLILESSLSCLDRRTDQGNALFPENLIGELHSARAVIEAYSRSAEIARKGGPYACGLAFGNKGALDIILQVTWPGAKQKIAIDRWE